MAYNTGNPVPSSDPMDLFDNAENLDIALNSKQEAWVDRLGQLRQSYYGFENEFDRFIETSNDTFKNFIASSGYEDLGDYASGLVVERYNQIFIRNGEFYRVKPSIDLPYVLTGEWDEERTNFSPLGDALLRQQLASYIEGNGPDLIGYSPGLPGSLNFSVKKALDESVDLRTKFGLTGNIDDDQTNAWNNLISYINGLPKGGGAIRLHGCYRIAGPHLSLTSSIIIKGDGPARSRLLFDGAEGLVFDMSGWAGGSIGVILQDMALTTNGNNKRGIFLLGNTGGSNASPKLLGRNVYMASEAKFNGDNTTTNEWGTFIQLGVNNGEKNASEVKFDDLWLYGADANGQFSTKTGSQGIISYGVTGLQLNRPKIFLVGGDAVQLNGPGSEGMVLNGGTIVAVNRGVAMLGLGNPCNNHIITNTHISPYLRAIYSQDSGDMFNPIANFVSKVFVLERGDAITKPEPFIGIDVMWRESFIEADVRANSAPNLSQHEKVAFRVGRDTNRISGHSHNMHYVYDEDNYSGTSTTRTNDVNLTHTGTLTSFLRPGSVIPTGRQIGNLEGAGAVRSFANSHYITRLDGLNLLRMADGNFLIGNTGRSNCVFDMKNSPGASAADGRLYCAGGNAGGANYGGGWIMYGASFRMDAPVTPHADNAYSLGSPSLRWNQVYAANTTISSSDARLKGPWREMTVAEIKAAKMIAKEIGFYKWLDAIEKKGEDDARWHSGLTVQRVIEIMSDCGLNPMSYGFICHDSWEASPEIRDIVEAKPAIIKHHSEEPEVIEEGVVIREAIPARDEVIEPAVEASNTLMQPAREAGDIYSFRYEQLNLFIARGIESRISKLEDICAGVDNE